MDADNQQPRPVEIGWLAGMIDGEGFIGTNIRNRGGSTQYKPTIQITGTNKDGLDAIDDILNRMTIGHHISWREATGYGHLPYWRVAIDGLNRVDSLLTQITDLLIIKKKQADMLATWIQFREARPIHSSVTDEELALVNLIKEANAGRLNDYTPNIKAKFVAEDKICECGTFFTQKYVNQIYCSSKCRGKFQMQHYRAKIKI